MTKAEKASRKMLIEMIARGDSTAKVLGGAVQLAILCGRPDEQAVATVADRAIRAFCDIETKGPTVVQTIYDALTERLGRLPTHEETKAEVRRIIGEGFVRAAEAHQKRHKGKRS